MRKEPWKKVLYTKSNYPDNYVDREIFLKELKKNLTLKTYLFGHLVKESCSVTQEFTSVVLFVTLFCHLQEDAMNPKVLIMVAGVTTLTCYLASNCINVRIFESLTNGVMDSLQSFIFLSFLFALSPILKTLTESISTDTIYAMTTVMFIIHLLLHDYSRQASVPSAAVSLNAAVFGAVCLSSRLSTTLHVFTLMFVAIVLFALAPRFRQTLLKWHVSIFPSVVITVTGITTVLLVLVSLGAAAFYCLAVLAITFLCPAWFVRLQRFKNIIHGPWDEAMPTL